MRMDIIVSMIAVTSHANATPPSASLHRVSHAREDEPVDTRRAGASGMQANGSGTAKPPTMGARRQKANPGGFLPPTARSPDRSPVPALALAGPSLVVGPRAVALRAAVLAEADRAFL